MSVSKQWFLDQKLTSDGSWYDNGRVSRHRSRIQLVDAQSEPSILQKTLITADTSPVAFPKTLHHLFLYPPVALLVPENSLAASSNATRLNNLRTQDDPSLLVQCLEAQYGMHCESVPRSQWNRDQGTDRPPI